MTRSNSTTPSNRRTLTLKRDAATPSVSVEERLHKVLAQSGLGSRRALEERIAQSQVKVNGEIATVGSSVKNGDRVEMDGRTFVASVQNEAPRILAYNKPEGEVTTREDPEGRPTVFDRLPQIKGARWINVGRLDINTTGLLLLTTDGDLANKLMHPSTGITREYVCRIQGEPTDEQIQQLAKGVTLEDGQAKFDEIESIGASDSHTWFRVVLNEGRNREVRRMWEAVGYQVSRLKRVRYGSISLPRLLKRGQYEELPMDVVESLRTKLQLDQSEPCLTLQPVIGQRRAKATEYRPAPRDQRAWTQSQYGDESRELRAFDNIREERSGRPPRGGKPMRKGPGGFSSAPRGPRPANGPQGPRGPRPQRSIPDDIGNRMGPSTGPRGRKSNAPGYENPAEHRTWYAPEGVTTTSRVAPPRQGARPSFGDRNNSVSPYGNRGEGRGPGGFGGDSRRPSRGPGSEGRGPSRGPGGFGGDSRGPSRGPGGEGRGPSRGPGGFGGDSRGPSRGPGGNTRGPGGYRGPGAPRFNKPRD